MSPSIFFLIYATSSITLLSSTFVSWPPSSVSSTKTLYLSFLTNFLNLLSTSKSSYLFAFVHRFMSYWATISCNCLTSNCIRSPTFCMVSVGGTTLLYKSTSYVLSANALVWSANWRNSVLVARASYSFFSFVMCLVWFCRAFLHYLLSSVISAILSDCF